MAALISVFDFVMSPVSSSTLEAAGQGDQVTGWASMIRATKGKEATAVEGQGGGGRGAFYAQLVGAFSLPAHPELWLICLQLHGVFP